MFIAFNFLEIFKNGGVNKSKERLKEIEIWCNEEKINFEWTALFTPNGLVHSKGYAIFQKDVSNNIKDGFIIVNSANFTNAGYFGKNIELGYISVEVMDLEAFQNIFDMLWEDLNIDIDNAIKIEDKQILQYSILSKGVFIHKWSDTLSQRIGIQYKLTDKAKKQGLIAPELAKVGFESGNTFTRQVLNIKNIPKKNIPSNFIKAYTIETFLGRWCTKESWNLIKENNRDIQEYIEAFNKITTPKKLNKIIKKSLEVEKDLIKKKLIKKPPSNHLENWKERINDLRKNKGKLERIFMGYDFYDLPYSIENKKEIKELFESLWDTIEYSKIEKKIVKKVKSTYKNKNLDELKLNDSDIETIKSYG